MTVQQRILTVWYCVLYSFCLSSVNAQLGNLGRSAPFDCSRFNPTYCCSSRIRENCPQLCSRSPCNRPKPFVANFLTQLPFMSQVGGFGVPPGPPPQPAPALFGQPPPQRPDQSVRPHDGSWHKASRQRSEPPPPGIILPPPGSPLSVGPPGEIPPPNWESQVDQRVPSDLSGMSRLSWNNGAGPAGPQANLGPPTHASGAGVRHFGLPGPVAPPPSIAGTQGGLNQGISGPESQAPFPTLIPDAKLQTTIVPGFGAQPTPFPVDVIQVTPSAQTSEGNRAWSSVLEGLNAQRNDGGNATPKTSGILTPPQLGGLDGELVELAGQDAQVETIEKQGTSSHFGAIQDQIAGSIRLGSATTSFTPEPHQRTTRPEPERRPWSFKISPSAVQTSSNRDLPIPEDKDEFVEVIGKQNAKQSNGSHQGGIFSDKFNVVVDALFTQQTIDAITNITGLRPKKPRVQPIASTTTPAGPTSTPTTTTSLSPTTTLLQLMGNVSMDECGKAPLFRPCVGIEEANQRLLQCCRAKAMPDGCLPLCRFDTTQAEIKRQFDAGKCGVLNVAPFLECASQNQDNRACCHHRNISGKSGPQCEVFCHPRDGLGSLGLQHLSCQNVIADLLQCHHSGLR